MRKNKHGRIGVKQRMSRPHQPVTLVEAEAEGFRKGWKAGHKQGFTDAVAEIGDQLLKRKLSSANMRKWFQEHHG
jgi:hypothetical protein